MDLKERIEKAVDTTLGNWAAASQANRDSLIRGVLDAIEPKPAHSPLPWREGQGDFPEIFDALGMSVVSAYPGSRGGLTGANRDLILKAVNGHEKLVKACIGAREWLKTYDRHASMPVRQISEALREAGEA